MQNNDDTIDEIVDFLNIAYWKFSRQDIEAILRDLRRKILSDFRSLIEWYQIAPPEGDIEWDIDWTQLTPINKQRIKNLYVFQSFQRILHDNPDLNFEVKKRMLIEFGSTSDIQQLQAVKRIQQNGQPVPQQIDQINAKINELKRILQDYNYITGNKPMDDRIQKFLRFRTDNKDDTKFLGPRQLEELTDIEKDTFLKVQDRKITQIINNLKKCNNLTQKTFGAARVPKYVPQQPAAP